MSDKERTPFDLNRERKHVRCQLRIPMQAIPCAGGNSPHHPFVKIFDGTLPAFAAIRMLDQTPWLVKGLPGR